MATFKITEDPMHKVSITPPTGMSPRRMSPIQPQQGQAQASSPGNVWSNIAGVHDDEEKFRVNLDVSNFATNDLSVKSMGNKLVIQGKQIERQPTAKKYVAREFNLNYILPQNVDVDEMTSSLSERGVLTVEAPKLPSPKPSPANKRKI